MNSTCLVRIGLNQVSAVWLDAGSRPRGGKAPRKAADARAATVDLPDETPESVARALDEALTAVAPKPGRMLFGFDLSRLAAPDVRVAIADPYLRSALMKFARLPKSGADRALLIGERFSREHRLEKAAFEVAASPVEISEEQQSLLCCAVPRRLIGFIRQQLAAHNLYADIIAPELHYGLQGPASGGAGGKASGGVRALLGGSRAKTPAADFAPAGGVMLIYPDYATLALRDETGALAHVASLRRGRQTTEEFTRRLNGRLHRYMVLLGAEDLPLTLEFFADDGPSREIAQALAAGLAHLPVTVVDGRPASAARPKTSGMASILKRLAGRKPEEPEPFWRAMLMGAP